MRKWQSLTLEQMQMPTPKELQLNKAAYRRQLDDLQQRLQKARNDKERAPLLAKCNELRDALRMLDELQDEMMKDIVLKKAAQLATHRQRAQFQCMPCAGDGKKAGHRGKKDK